MKNYSSKEILAILHKDGWRKVRQTGSHIQLQHPTKPGTVTVPHPRKNLKLKTIKNIFIQAELEI